MSKKNKKKNKSIFQSADILYALSHTHEWPLYLSQNAKNDYTALFLSSRCYRYIHFGKAAKKKNKNFLQFQYYNKRCGPTSNETMRSSEWRIRNTT